MSDGMGWELQLPNKMHMNMLMYAMNFFMKTPVVVIIRDKDNEKNVAHLRRQAT